jgi:hypothetical protein
MRPYHQYAINGRMTHQWQQNSSGQTSVGSRLSFAALGIGQTGNKPNPKQYRRSLVVHSALAEHAHPVIVRVFVMLDLYFDSVKCMLVSVKLLCKVEEIGVCM